MVEDYIAVHGIEVEARYAGSYSKGTFLDDPDLDLFLMFPDTVSEEDLKRVGLQAGEDILHGIRMYSEQTHLPICPHDASSGPLPDAPGTTVLPNRLSFYPCRT